MKTLLAIQGYPGANDAVARHWTYYVNSGADTILGIGTEDGGCKWPPGLLYLNVGPNAYIDRGHLPRRLIETIDVCLKCGYHDRIIVIEYDVLFFKPLPELPPGFHGQLAGYNFPPFKCQRFYHSPWVFDHETAREVVARGREMLAAGETEKGNPDMFIGLLVETYNIPASPLENCFTQNSLDNPAMLEEARQRRLNGLVAVHGCKTAEQLAHLVS